MRVPKGGGARLVLTSATSNLEAYNLALCLVHEIVVVIWGGPMERLGNGSIAEPMHVLADCVDVTSTGKHAEGGCEITTQCVAPKRIQCA